MTYSSAFAACQLIKSSKVTSSTTLFMASFSFFQSILVTHSFPLLQAANSFSAHLHRRKAALCKPQDHAYGIFFWRPLHITSLRSADTSHIPCLIHMLIICSRYFSGNSLSGCRVLQTYGIAGNYWLPNPASGEWAYLPFVEIFILSYFLHMSDYTQINLVFQYVLWIDNASIINGELSEKKKNGIFLIFYSEKERKNRKNRTPTGSGFCFMTIPVHGQTYVLRQNRCRDFLRLTCLHFQFQLSAGMGVLIITDSRRVQHTLGCLYRRRIRILVTFVDNGFNSCLNNGFRTFIAGKQGHI